MGQLQASRRKMGDAVLPAAEPNRTIQSGCDGIDIIIAQALRLCEVHPGIAVEAISAMPFGAKPQGAIRAFHDSLDIFQVVFIRHGVEPPIPAIEAADPASA